MILWKGKNKMTNENEEKQILKEVRKLIKNPNFQKNQSFFEMGGTSMQIIEIARIVFEITGKELDMSEFFKEPYIEKIKFTEEDNNLNTKLNKEKAILFIHDGSGNTDSYRFFYEKIEEKIKNDFKIIRINFPSEMILEGPQIINIPKLTQKYIQQYNLEDYQIEYIFGWCIGGKVAYEVSKQLSDIKNVVIMNSPAPNQNQAVQLDFDSELEFVKTNFKIINLQIPKKTIEGLWSSVIEYYESNLDIFNIVKEKVPPYVKFLIPNFYSNKLTPSYFISRLNLIRSFSIAHGLYKTDDVVETPNFFFFNAIDQNQDKKHMWGNFVLKSKFFDLPGIHTDMVNQKNSQKILDIVFSEE